MAELGYGLDGTRSYHMPKLTTIAPRSLISNRENVPTGSFLTTFSENK